MRAGVAAVILLLAPFTARAEDPADPKGCANYTEIRTGGDTACDAAIAAETDPVAKSILLFRRAYMEDAAGDFETYPKALADLGDAIALWPGNWGALNERGYLYNEYGRWKDAVADLDAAVRLRPSDPQGYGERALARFGLGDLAGALDDRSTVVTLEPAKVANLTERANAGMWLGRFDDAAQDLYEAERLAEKSGDRQQLDSVDADKADLRRWTTVASGADAKAVCGGAKSEDDYLAPGLVGECTRAFLDGATPRDKADALTQRANALERVEQDREAGVDDLRIAYAVDPSNPDRAFNLGSRLQNVGRCEEALVYLDGALAAGRTYDAYAARAGAKYCLGDLGGAIADGKKSLEMQPNAIALTVVGDAVYAQSKSFDGAKVYWIGAYRLGDHDDGLVARLKSAGVPIPPPDDPAPPPKPSP